MFYALVLICLASLPDCEAESAVFAEQSPPLFCDLASCLAGARAHLRGAWPSIKPTLDPDAAYQFAIICEEAEPETPAP